MTTPLLQSETSTSLSELIASRPEGMSLPGAFYHDPGVYKADVERIWHRSWLFAGHGCEIPQPGDYITVAVDSASVIVLRDDDGQVRAFHNVCRHRGTRLCSESAGRVGKIVCPYHQWTYGRGGELVGCRGMHEFDKSSFGLLPVRVEEVEGLIFINLDEHAADFTPVREVIGPAARPQGFGRAKVAKIVDYEIAANWKLVWENNRECYHCNVNHPQYIKANFDHYNADDTSEKTRQRIEKQVRESEAKWAACGLAVTHKQTGMTLFPEPERDIWYSANRTALVEGWVSETMDGKQVAPLMGDYQSADVGTLRIRTLPNLWNHSSCDHAVSTRLLPAGPRKTLARVYWLVKEGAQEGQDYELDKIMPFWQLTSEQDWDLCAQAQRGVDSPFYVPGPFSTYKEYNVDAFVRWYLRRMGQA